MPRKPLVLAFLLLNALWTFAMVAAPFTLPPGTVRGLDGNANVIDHWDRWQALPWYGAITYAFGDLNCHQMETRSLLAHGNQLPVDARMTAMFITANLGFLLVLTVPSRPRARDAAWLLMPTPMRGRRDSSQGRLAGLTILLLIGLVPTAVDGFAQLLTPYESNNALRLATGALLGFFGALWAGLLFDSLTTPPPWPRASAAPTQEPQRQDA